MISPRDPVYLPHPLLVDSETRQPLTERQLHHLENLKEAGAALYDAMHFAEGSNPPGEHQEHTWQTRRMAHAATLLETALMFARKETMQTP
jgi:hypothetical protein